MTLKDEVNDCWLASVFMPAITNLRIMARNDKLSAQDAAAVFQVPLQVSVLGDICVRNRVALIAEFKHDFGVPLHVETIQHYMDSMAAQEASNAAEMTPAPTAKTAQVVVFDDETNSEELVFGIAVNHPKKRITFAFRGSVTSNDYKADFKVFMETIQHPTKPNQRLAVHGGIYQYLHRKRKDGTSKWDVIQVYLQDVMQENPGYELYLTGHSLGGSLAILLAFRLATIAGNETNDTKENGSKIENNNDPKDDDDDKKDTKLGPISVITFGPMLVGDLRFRRAFQQLEQERKIRCLCVVNQGDFIPLIPERGLPFTVYRRVGVYLRLSESGEMVFSYNGRANSLFGAWWRDVPNQIVHRVRLAHTLCCVKNFSANHDVRHYTDNIKHCAADLSKVEWDLFERGRDAGGFIYDVW